ncbi:MAG: asparagine synthetase B family protein [Rhizobacter sp.]
MTRPSCPDLCLGSPLFDDSRLAALATQSGAEAAWRAALAGDALAALEHVHGNFAVGLRLDDGRVVLAVDRFAQQTLCYRVVDGALCFAERADALREGGSDIDPQAIFDYLYFHAIPSPRTIFRGVLRLPPGHMAVFDAGRLTITPYWVPSFDPIPSAQGFDDLKTEFLTLLRGAVSTQLDGSKPACFLSGGTDSSTVAGMIGQVAGRPAATYSIGFEAEGYDEMAFARIAARRFGTEHHEYYVTPDDLVRSIGDVAQSYDQPFGNSSALPAFYCAQMARQDGVTRLLAGDGGDELFGGNARYAKQRVFGWYGQVPAALRTAVVEPLFAMPAMTHVPLLKKGVSYIEQARVPMPDRLQMYNLLLRLGIDRVLTPGFLSQVAVDGPAQHQREVWQQARTRSALDRTLAFDWRYTLAESDLPKVCGTTRLAGVSVGFPLLDDRLLAFSQKLPQSYKLKGLKLRWFFKEALRGFLPDEIITKKKQGFGLPFGPWLTRHAGLQALVRESWKSLAKRGLVRPDFLHDLMDKQLAEHPGYYGEMVWILLMLEQWLRKHAPEFRIAR